MLLYLLLFSFRNEGTDFCGSVYQKVNENLETAINVGWTSGTNTTRFALGAKYCLDADSSLRAKVSNTSQIGLGYTHQLRDGKIPFCWSDLIIMLGGGRILSNFCYRYSGNQNHCMNTHAVYRHPWAMINSSMVVWSFNINLLQLKIITVIIKSMDICFWFKLAEDLIRLGKDLQFPRRMDTVVQWSQNDLCYFNYFWRIVRWKWMNEWMNEWMNNFQNDCTNWN